jgi:hypothetical protein
MVAAQGKSKAELERLLYPERVGKRVEFVADEQTQDDLQRMCELLAIAPSDLTTLIKRTARIARGALDPMLQRKRGGSVLDFV